MVQYDSTSHLSVELTSHLLTSSDDIRIPVVLESLDLQIPV